MNILNCLIVDDEELARRLVASYCERLPQLRVVGQAANPLDALQLLREHRVDLLFLDIQMPEMKGTEMLRLLRRAPAVVLTTAYAEYALESYELDVTDYLLKPISFERFLRAVEKVQDLRAASPPPPAAAPTRIDGAPPPSIDQTSASVAAANATYQIVKSDHKTYRIPHADILYVESMREYVVYHTADGKTMSLGSLKRLEEELPANFLRVHKSYIVAKDKVTHLEGNLLHLGAITVPTGASYRARALRELFGGDR